MSQTLLRAERLCFAYRDAPVLRDVSVRLDAGEVVALIGPNGSGKSTLIRLLLGQLRGSGTITWDGRELASWKRRELARRVAYLPQNPTWDIEHRVIDVLRLGRAPYWSAFGIESARDMEVVNAIASQLGLSDLLSRRIDELSGGQRQRVFIGRCLVQEPRALLLDEPNTYLDIRHQVELVATLRELARQRKVGGLMALHDLNLAASLADRMMLLGDGRIAVEGDADTVLCPELLTQIYGVRMQRVEKQGNTPVVVPVVDEPARAAG
jgi:iron complex transport system ATP-binding protein